MADGTVVLDDVELHHTTTGTGPTVLLLHAGGEKRGVWAPVSAHLTEYGLRTIAYDLRGHGDSTGPTTRLRAITDDVRAMIHRETPPIAVVGASLGGFAALDAVTDPAVADRVAALVLVDVVPDPDRVRAWFGASRLRGRHDELMEDILASGPALFTRATTLPIPALVVRAGRSPLADSDVDRFRTTNRHVTIAHVPDASHLVARDAPTELAHLIATHVGTRLASGRAVEDALALQRTLGAEHLDHPGGTLYTHLRRVHALTADWNATPRTRLAALSHATYGTDGFAHPLLPPTDRDRLRAVIGADAESLVHLYGACEREPTYRLLGQDPLPITDRFTGTQLTLRDHDLHDFALLTIANELDVARNAPLPAHLRAGIRDLVTALSRYAPHAAERALTDDALR